MTQTVLSFAPRIILGTGGKWISLQRRGIVP